AKLDAGSQHPADPLLQFGVATLDAVEVEAGLVLARHHRAGRAAAKADAVSGAAELDDQHARLGRVLTDVCVFELTGSHRVHDRLEPAAVATGRGQAEAPHEAVDQRLAEAIA